MTSEELQALIESNARSINALADERRAAVETNRINMGRVNQRLERIEQSLERTTQQQQDNTVAVAQILTAQAETGRQIDILIAEGREQRNWLQAAQEHIQTIFVEIQRLWQAVNAA